jgi:hypothetical protein
LVVLPYTNRINECLLRFILASLTCVQPEYTSFDSARRASQDIDFCDWFYIKKWTLLHQILFAKWQALVCSLVEPVMSVAVGSFCRQIS